MYTTLKIERMGCIMFATTCTAPHRRFSVIGAGRRGCAKRRTSDNHRHHWHHRTLSARVRDQMRDLCSHAGGGGSGGPAFRQRAQQCAVVVGLRKPHTKKRETVRGSVIQWRWPFFFRRTVARGDDFDFGSDAACD